MCRNPSVHYHRYEMRALAWISKLTVMSCYITVHLSALSQTDITENEPSPKRAKTVLIDFSALSDSDSVGSHECI